MKNSFEQPPMPTPEDDLEETEEIVDDSIEQKEKPEIIPTSEDIELVFEKLFGEKKYETRRKLEDDFPISGSLVAKQIEGEWNLTP